MPNPSDVPAKQVRVWIVGFGTVGRWLARTLDSQAERLAVRYGIAVSVVGLANERDGFIYDSNGLDLRSLSALVAAGRSIAEQPAFGAGASSPTADVRTRGSASRLGA